MAAKEKTEKKKLGLSSQIFIALIGGAIVGVLIHYFMPEGYIRDTIIINGILYVIGQGFVRLLQMLVVPLVFCSLVCGSMAIGDTKTLGGVGVRIIIFYLCTTAIAVCVALSIASLINPGIGISLEAIETSEVTVAESTSFADTLLNIIPTNPINALAEGDMLPVIVFALFVGVMLAKLGGKAST
ncbi:MAG: dicarboxylate/amino acid:cation symporter, partial [Clostridiales bacterium]|nr:dicarboxylate/amino acid:cation symporter [Clostridiales bacterium]